MKTGLSHKKYAAAAARYAVSAVFAFIFLAPMLFMVFSSFKGEKRIFEDLTTAWKAFLPTSFTLENYIYVFGRVPFGRYLFNSLFVTGTTVTIGLMLNSMLAFCLARLEWPFRKAIVVLIVALSIVPLETVAVPMLVMVNSFPWFDGSASWLDTYRVQIIPFTCDAFSVFLFYQFFIGIPKAYDEAGMIDGCSPFQLYVHIVTPLSRSVFATVTILNSLMLWNSYLWPLMVTRSETVRPLPVGITALYVLNMRWGPILAFATLISLPIISLFVLFQKRFVESMASCGIKG